MGQESGGTEGPEAINKATNYSKDFDAIKNKYKRIMH